MTGERRGPGVWLVAGVAVAIVAEGLVAGRTYRAFEYQTVVLTLAAGWVTALAGLATWQRAPASRIGPLLALAGAAAFLPALSRWLGDPSGRGLAWVAAAVVAHAILTAPSGRAAGRLDALAIAMLYLLAVVVPLDGLSLSIGLVAVMGARRWRTAGDPGRPSAEVAGLVLSAGLAAGPLLDLLASGMPVNELALRAAAVTGAALLVATATVRVTAVPARLTDLVLQLDPTTATSITDELRRLTRDPLLEVAYPLPAGGFSDSQGRPLRLPEGGDAQVVTELADGSGIRIMHARRLEAEQAMRQAIARAAELSAANVRLLGELQAQAAEVRASQVRLLEAEAVERAAVGDRLRTRLDPILDSLAAGLAGDDRSGVRRTLADVRAEVRALADGLGPRALAGDGLAGALSALAERSAVPVSLVVAPLPPLGAAVEATGWFVCSEALANVAKHASATSIQVSAAASDGRLVLTVADDGAGGADPARGSGLRGMRDRVEAVGGCLELTSPPGSGTTLRATLPMEAA